MLFESQTHSQIVVNVSRILCGFLGAYWLGSSPLWIDEGDEGRSWFGTTEESLTGENGNGNLDGSDNRR